MAKNWKEAQINEKLFWKQVYLDKKNKDTYQKIDNKGAIGFTKEVLKRHKKNFRDLNKKKNY